MEISQVKTTRTTRTTSGINITLPTALFFVVAAAICVHILNYITTIWDAVKFMRASIHCLYTPHHLV